MKALIIGDSLAAQRPDDDLDEKERWPYLFSKETNLSIINLSKGFSTTQKLGEEASINAAKKVDKVIIQLGVVDCAPRRFRRWEMQIIYKFPAVIQKKLISFLKNRRTQSLEKCYVNPIQFKENIVNFISQIKAPVLYIHILPASGNLKIANPQITSAITQYNKIVSSLSETHKNLLQINFSEEEVMNYTLEDGYHLNRKGHIEIAKRLANL